MFRLIVAAALLGLSGAAHAEFIRPAKPTDPPVYGVKGGIVVAIHPAALDARPAGGPRGLLRVGYEEAGQYYLVNYIAVEPLVGGVRGYSELERGGDGRPGKLFCIDDVRVPPGRGELTFTVHVEPFANGARPVIEVTLFEKQPDRVRFRVTSAAGGKAMAECVLTATMGNQSRCRQLWLKSAAVFAPTLYAGYQGTDFVEKRLYRLNELHRTAAGDVVAAISPNEFEPREVWPFPNGAWSHPGRWMAQFWLKPKGTFDGALHVRVNGRRTYWMGRTPIPGGIAYENFELREPFRPGVESWFGFTTGSPAKAFGFSYDVAPPAAPRRTVPVAEAAHAAAAGDLTNGDFRAGLTGWHAEGGAAGFRTFDLGRDKALTTFADKKDADTGRLFQCFRVPADATDLEFHLHGGAEAERLRVALWHGERLHRTMTGRDDNTPFRVHWDLRPLRGEVATLEVVDQSDRPWGFIGAHGFMILRERR